MAHQLLGSPGSLSCSKMLCQRQEEHYSPTENGQYHSSGICEQTGGDSFPQTELYSQRALVMVHEQGYYPGGRTSARSPQYDCRRGISSDEGSLRLDAEPSDFLQNQSEMGPIGSGHVRIQADDSTGEIFQLEARSRSRSSGCLQSGLEQHTREGLCQPPMEPSRQSAEHSPATASHASSGGSSMEEPAMVPHSTRNAGRLPSPTPSRRGPDHTITPNEHTSRATSTSRLAYLRRRYEDKEISEEGKDLLLASWRQKFQSTTTHFLESGWAGATNGTQIPFQDL